ncbi:uncharacterized protein DS421_7g211030 [Arachis hypogaea]|nr:uncharacterized protein DS421_7g211030 [Arachis hypogaea]
MYRRRHIHGDSINKAQLKDFWDQISDQSFDSRLRTVFDMVDKDADGRITEEEIKEIICLSATTNKLSNIQQQTEEYAALIVEELDPEETGFIMVMVAASFIGALVYAIAAVCNSAFVSVKVSNQTSSPGSVHIDNLDKNLRGISRIDGGIHEDPESLNLVCGIPSRILGLNSCDELQTPEGWALVTDAKESMDSIPT